MYNWPDWLCSTRNLSENVCVFSARFLCQRQLYFGRPATSIDQRDEPMRMQASAAVGALTVCVLSSVRIPAQDLSNDEPAATTAGTAAEDRGVAFPDLTGPYSVGRATYALVDSSRKEIFTDATDDVRELVVTIHYPADVAAQQPAAPYADAKLAAALATAYHTPAALFDAMHSHAVDDAPCASQADGFPVVLFSPGFKSHPLFYTAILEELASHGFVVASLCHPYSTGATVFPDGRVLRANDEGTKFELHKGKDIDHQTMIRERDAIGEVWLADVRFVLDSLARMNKEDRLLAGRLDVSRVGIFGHSFGGATAAAAVERDPRFRAGINLDGSDFSGPDGAKIGDRFLWLCSEPPDFSKLPPSKLRQALVDKGDAAAPSKDQPRVAEATAPGIRIVRKDTREGSLPPPKELKNARPNNGMRGPAGSRITITGARHQTFESDQALVKATPSLARFAFGRDLGTIDGRRAVTVINALVLGFFRKNLNGETVAFLDDPASEFPEAIRGDAEYPTAIIR